MTRAEVPGMISVESLSVGKRQKNLPSKSKDGLSTANSNSQKIPFTFVNVLRGFAVDSIIRTVSFSMKLL